MMNNIYILIEKIINKKYEYTKILIGKITLTFIFFGIILTLILLNENFIKCLNSYNIVTTNMIFSKVINIMCENKLFNILINALGLSLTPNASQLLCMLILGYMSMISLVILSTFFNKLILPLVTVSSGLFMFYLKITGNWLISSYTLVDFYGIKILKKLTEDEKWSYLNNIFLKYENNLDDNLFIKNFNIDYNKIELLNKFKDINDTDLIKESFYKLLESYTQIKLTDSEINYFIIEAFKKLNENQSKKVNISELFKQIKENDLIGHTDIINYINNYINNNINSYDLSDLTNWINFDILNDYKLTILLSIVTLIGIAFIGYYIWSTNSINELQEIAKNQVKQDIARQELNNSQINYNNTVNSQLEKIVDNTETSNKELLTLCKNIERKIEGLETLDIKKEQVINQMVETIKKGEAAQNSTTINLIKLNKDQDSLLNNVMDLELKHMNLNELVEANSVAIKGIALIIKNLKKDQ